jgi:hypothetical protein
VASFSKVRDRVLAAHAAMAAAERECFRATADEVAALGAEAGLGQGMLLIFHAAPRGEAVWALDDQDCSADDAVLEAVDLTDVSGRRFRLTRAGLSPLPAGARVPRPAGPLPVAQACPGAMFPARPEGSPEGGLESRPEGRPGADARVAPELDAASSALLGGVLWQRAVLTWVDLHRALACWTGRWLAASLVIAPETGDVASLHPLYCPDRGQDFEVVTSLRLSPETVPADDLEAALLNVLEESQGVTADLVELDLRFWLDSAAFTLPGYPAHGPGQCESPADER